MCHSFLSQDCSQFPRLSSYIIQPIFNLCTLGPPVVDLGTKLKEQLSKNPAQFLQEHEGRRAPRAGAMPPGEGGAYLTHGEHEGSTSLLGGV